MLVLLRIILGAAFLYEMAEGARNAPGTGEVGDMTGAFYLTICVGLAILNAMVWAPYLGTIVSGPLTGVITESTYVERTNWLLRLSRWFEVRGFRRMVLFLSFWEGVRHPTEPAAFATGFRNSKSGSWFEKIFAREVFRFNNTQNCVQTYLALKRHGIDPRPHQNQEVNIMLLSIERPPRPAAEILSVPAAPKAALPKRNPRIRLFRQPHLGTMAEAEEPGAVATSEPELTVGPAALPASTDVATESVHSNWFAQLCARVTAFLRAH